MCEEDVVVNPQESYEYRLLLDLLGTYIYVSVLLGLYGIVCAFFFPASIAHVSIKVWFSVLPGIFIVFLIGLAEA